MAELAGGQRCQHWASFKEGKMVLPGSAHVISALGIDTLSYPPVKITGGIFMNSQTFYCPRNQGEDESVLGLG